MAAAAILKRRAPDQELPSGAASFSGLGNTKRPRYSLIGSVDDYDMGEVIGEGAYGVVYEARHRVTGRAVALKWVLGKGPDGHGPPDRRALGLEAACLAKCRGHPSIVQIEAVVADAETGSLFLVTELVAGPSLSEKVRKPFSEEDARAMMRQLVGPAKGMHEAGVIHRDIKPDNVIVGPGGQLKVCDFGLATMLKPPGTPYQEEQLAGDRCYGTAVDMWALGCVMSEMLTGKIIFDYYVETKEELLTEVCALRDKIAERGPSAFESIPGLSLAGREVLAGLLAFQPDERLTAAAALEHRWFAEEAESPVEHLALSL